MYTRKNSVKYKRHVPWYNYDCKRAKSEVYKNKRTIKSNNNDINKRYFLESRNNLSKVKRKCKYLYNSKER